MFKIDLLIPMQMLNPAAITMPALSPLVNLTQSEAFGL